MNKEVKETNHTSTSKPQQKRLKKSGCGCGRRIKKQ
ncbi:hypothetical protein HNR27_001339 [Ornithinibacillus bavariensis]